jgi:hypothetical protein
MMLLTWTLYALAVLLSSPGDPTQAFVPVCLMHFAGAGLLVIGAHVGGRLAHVHHLPSVDANRELTG